MTSARTDDDAISVWLVPVRGGVGGIPVRAERLLDDEERTALARLRREIDRAQYLTVHVARRLLVSGRLGIEPEEVAFAPTACPLCGAMHGRPALDGLAGVLDVSISRTAGVVAIALAEATVGVDVETVEARVKADDLGAALHPSELADLANLPSDQRDLAALRCWARKEAVLKGIGTGLGIEPSTIEVGVGRSPRPAGSVATRDGVVDVGEWTVVDLDAGGEAVAALAHAGPRTTTVVVRRIELGELLAIAG